MPDITAEYLALRDQYIEARFARLNRYSGRLSLPPKVRC